MLKVEHLTKEYHSGFLKKNTVVAAENISLEIGEQETLGIVGESGSGKSTLAQCIVRLIEPTEGIIRFHGQDICKMKKKALCQVRRKIQLVFQDPDSALDPRMTIRESLEEALKVQKKAQNPEEQVRNMLLQVGLNEEHANRYPHQMSGGQNQRVVIARALSFEPELLIADEATASLDVSVQAQIWALIRRLQKEKGFSMIVISHDMEIVRRICDSVLVMYQGRMVEKGRTEEILENAEHPYTRMLLSCTEEHVREWIDYLNDKKES